MKGTDKLFTLQDAVKVAGPRAFTTMVKPAGSLCNMNCIYCYYLDKAGQYGGKEPIMSLDLLETYIKQYIEANDVDTVTFCWHGGEPTLLGTDYYRKVLEFQTRYSDGKKIENTIQTNGTAINEEWCEFFSENNFLVGLSIDGPKNIHDRYRGIKAGGSSFEKAVNAARLFRKYNVEFNTLSVVNKMSEDRGLEVYLFLRDVIGSRYMQFLPAVESVKKLPGNRRPIICSPDNPDASIAAWSVSGLGFGRFMCDIFDTWVRNDVGKVFVQLFDSTLAQYVGEMPGVCSLAETCGDAIVVEHNGDVYSCDHFVYPQYRLGNIKEDNLRNYYLSPAHREFGLSKRNSLPDECLRCEYFDLCHGECPKHRFLLDSEGKRKNYLCEGYKYFFAHTKPYMLTMRNLLERQSPPSLIMQYLKHQ